MDFNWEGAYTHSVAWSPVPLEDGNYKIAFVGKSGLKDGTLKADYDLFLVNLDGTGLVQLTDTPGVHKWDLEWSPFGDRIAVETYTPATNVGDIVVYQISYSGAGFIATLLGSVIPPDSPLASALDVLLNDWAKTQNKLVVNVGVPGQTVSGYQSDLWIIDLYNPSNPVQLTSTPDQSEYNASWSPNDTKIVFLSAGYFWVMNSDGSGAKQIATAQRVFHKGLEWRRNLQVIRIGDKIT